MNEKACRQPSADNSYMDTILHHFFNSIKFFITASTERESSEIKMYSLKNFEKIVITNRKTNDFVKNRNHNT